MENWQPSTLSWSFSRKTHFDSCRRHYFYSRFWGQDPKLRWKLYEMRNITTLTMLRGQVVHCVIADALNSVRLGVTTDAKAAKENFTRLIRERYFESAKRLWHIDNRPQGRKPSEFTNLLEHYYRYPNINERAREAQGVGWVCLENLVDSDFWRETVTAEPSRWQEIEGSGFPSFDIDGIQVYVRIDFAYHNGSPTIIDWKTGTPGDEDRKQLILYSLYARAKWDWDPLDTELAAAYLQPSLRVETFKPTREDIESVRDEVKRSFEEMMAVEPAFGPANADDFPMTDDLTNCRWCRFRGICDGAKRISEESVG